MPIPLTYDVAIRSMGKPCLARKEGSGDAWYPATLVGMWSPTAMIVRPANGRDEPIHLRNLLLTDEILQPQTACTANLGTNACDCLACNGRRESVSLRLRS